MSESDKPRSIDWEKELKDIDLTGFIHPESIVQNTIPTPIAKEDLLGSVEQRKIWLRLRNALAPLEEMMHIEARELVEAKHAIGIKKGRLQNIYRFVIRGFDGIPRKVVIKARKIQGQIYCARFEVDNDSFMFDKNGRIKRIRADASSLYDYETQKPHYRTFYFEKPNKMGILFEHDKKYKEITPQGTHPGFRFRHGEDFVSSIEAFVRNDIKLLKGMGS